MNKTIKAPARIDWKLRYKEEKKKGDKNKKCKFAMITFSATEDGDIDAQGNPHSQVGIWKSEYMTCEKFLTEQEQWDKNHFFTYCDRNRCEDCEYFEEEIKNDKEQK